MLLIQKQCHNKWINVSKHNPEGRKGMHSYHLNNPIYSDYGGIAVLRHFSISALPYIGATLLRPCSIATLQYGFISVYRHCSIAAFTYNGA